MTARAALFPVCVMALAVAMGGAAKARAMQVGTGSLIPGRSSGLVSSGLSDSVALDLSSGPPANRMNLIRRAAACAVKNDAPRVKRYIDAMLGDQYTKANWADFRGLYEDCLDGTRGNDMVFNVRGDGRYLWLLAAVSEAYLRAAPAAAPNPMPITALYQDAAFQELPSGGAKTMRCLVSVEPVKARAVIATEPGSPEEGRAIAELIPAIGKCTDQGATVAMKRDMLRLNIAPAYYRAAMKQNAALASGVN